MTELQCLVKLIQVKKMPKEALDIINERLGEVENILQTKQQLPPKMPLYRALAPNEAYQAPSMQKAVEDMMAHTKLGNPDAVIEEPVIPPQAVVVPRRTLKKEEVTTSVTSGGFTKGPKKW